MVTSREFARSCSVRYFAKQNTASAIKMTHTMRRYAVIALPFLV
jgi:hypothetical protein